MYSALLLADLVEARYAARLAEAERRRQLRQLSRARVHRVRIAWRGWRPHRRPATTCATAR